MANHNIIATWRSKVDIDRWTQRPYVVVDPMSRDSLLYLTTVEYQRLVVTSLANSVELLVVATPDTDRVLLGRRG
nr:MAG: hypothetical protein H3Bulk421055_000002 [Mitovirus sp.]